MAADKPKFLVVDGNSLLYRAFHAVPYLSTSEGLPTNAVYGFASMLLNLLNQYKPEAAVVAFDARGPTFRHEAFSDYKAQRPPAPDDLVKQMPFARDLVRALGIRILEVPGYEADDCVGTMALRAREAGYSVVIVTGDLDELQLVGDDIVVVTTKRGVTDTVEYDTAAVQERYGFRPEQMADYKALKGDPSDNVPGVKGIGDKTAARLVQEFGSIENLLSRLGEVKEERLRKLLEAGAEDARRSKDLCTIRTDVPCEITPDDCKLQLLDAAAARELFTRLEFKSLMPRLEEMLANAPEPPAPTYAVLDLPPPQTVTSSEELKSRTARLAPQSTAALAPLYSSQDPLWAELDGLAVHAEPDCRFYIPRPLVPNALEVLLNSNARLVVHDLKRLLHAAPNLQDRLAQRVSLDTTVAAYVLNPGRGSYDLPSLSLEILEKQLQAGTASGGLLGLAEDGENTARIVGNEAACIFQLAPKLEGRLEADGLLGVYRDIEHPLIPILAEMEQTGVWVDRSALTALSESLNGRIRALESEIHRLAGEEFNIGSTKQLQSVLFEKLKLPAGRKTKTGFSTDNEVLAALAAEHEIAAKILEYRELTKLKSTYADALVGLINPRTGRVHTSLNQTVTATGRLSSSNPNLQNIPIRTDVGREIRRAFAAVEGCLLVSADYSQIELRILAHITEEPELLRAFEADEDIHAHTASTLFGVRDEDVTPEMRRQAKTVNFAVLYGMTDYGLSRELGISVSDAKKFIEGYFARFPRIKEYVTSIQAQAREKGYVTTLLGRRRYIPEINSGNRNVRAFAERAAVNSPIQGTAADIMKLAMIRVASRLKREGSSAKLLLQVHDELLLEVPEQDAEALCKLVGEEMSQAYTLKVPLKVDVKRGPNWSDMDSLR